MAEENISSDDTVDGSCVAYLIPLRPFERQLISSLTVLLDQSDCPPFDPNNAPIKLAFQEWFWAGFAKRSLYDDFGDESFNRDYQGNRNIAYNAFIHFLAHTGGEQQNLARAEGFRTANTNFLLNLGDRSIEVVEVQPLEEDLELWETLSTLYHVFGQHWKYKERLVNEEGAFNIWTLIRKFTLNLEWPKNMDNVYRTLIMSNSFQAQFEVSRRTSTPNSSEPFQIEGEMGEFEQLNIQKRSNTVRKWPEDEPEVDDDGNIADSYLKFLLYDLGQKESLEDPRTYLHFIPWTDLTTANPDVLQRSGVNLEVPFLEGSLMDGWVLWTPPHSGFVWNHHIHTEDEVYEYNILNDWPFPDHYFHDQVLFIARELDQSDFLSELRQYWDDWNDCAITQTADGVLLLLETIPGLRFRSRKKHQDKYAALTYFRNLVEAHATNTLDTSIVRDIIGMEPAYSPLFEHSLRVIPEAQLLQTSWDMPIGEGENGVVYKAIWRKPIEYLATMRSGDQDLHIVLKDVVHRVGNSQDSLKKLLKELDVTYASLGGQAVGCIEFLGIALLRNYPEKMENTPILHSTEYADHKLFLVFERATQGTVIEFLLRYWKDTVFETSWSQLSDVLLSIASGIDSLHKHGVLHRYFPHLVLVNRLTFNRDLHMNNILVTDRYFPNDPQYPHEFQYIITDIGEGKVLQAGQEIRDLTDHRASYGAIEFRAPEVRGNHGWSTKAEVFSFGVIACKILDCRTYVCTSRAPEWIISELESQHSDIRHSVGMAAHIIPTALKKVIESCLVHSPDSRPSMRDIIHLLEDLTQDFFMDADEEMQDERPKRKIKWTYWNWNEALRNGRLGGSQPDGANNAPDDLDEFASVPELPD